MKSVSTAFVLAALLAGVSSLAVAQQQPEPRPQGMPAQVQIAFNPEHMCVFDNRVYSKGAVLNGYICMVPGTGLGINGNHLGWVRIDGR